MFSCFSFCNHTDCSRPPGASVRGILQAIILAWVAMSSSRGSSQGLNPHLCLLHCRRTLYPPSHLGSPGFSNMAQKLTSDWVDSPLYFMQAALLLWKELQWNGCLGCPSRKPSLAVHDIFFDQLWKIQFSLAPPAVSVLPAMLTQTLLLPKQFG